MWFYIGILFSRVSVMWFYIGILFSSVLFGLAHAMDSDYLKARPILFVAGFFPVIGIIVTIHLATSFTTKLYPNDLGPLPYAIVVGFVCWTCIVAFALFTIADSVEQKERHKRWARADKIRREATRKAQRAL